MRERWIDNFYTQREKALAAIPYPVRVLIGYYVHWSVASTLHGQGVGRFSAEEVHALKAEIWQHVDSVLKQRLRRVSSGQLAWYLGGKQPTEADAALYGFIVSGLVSARLVSAPENGAVDLGGEWKAQTPLTLMIVPPSQTS